MSVQHTITRGMIAGCIALLSAATWSGIIAPRLLSMPGDFQYIAEVASMDNPYDERAQKFTGEKRSLTKFSYEVTEKKEGVLLVKNSFDVRQITGEKIFSVERLYGIDPKTGEHRAGYGDRDREGSLFAPRHLPKGQDFVYWHVNYDVPVTMLYQGEEYMHGLRVYRFAADFSADQSADLTHLAGIPEKRGVELEVHLETWIEPTTGYLVQYKDSATGWFYNRQTGKRLHPWNSFRNAYGLQSVLDHVQIAKNQRSRLIILEMLIPGLLALFGGIFVFSSLRKRTPRLMIFIAWCVLCILIGGALWFVAATRIPNYSGTVGHIRLAAEEGLLASTVWVAEKNGYFADVGLDVEVTKFSSGRAALSALLQKESTIDIATVAQTPVVLNSFVRDDFGIIASMVSSPNDIKIIARKDRKMSTPRDLRGKKIGMTEHSTGHYFLGLFLAQNGLSLHDVQTVDMDASTLSEAISDGKVDAIASWEPHIYKAKKALGENGLIFESRGTFREDFYFAVFREYAETHPDVLKRFLMAIDRAAVFMKKNPLGSQAIVAARLNVDPEFVASVWNDFSFEIFLDQAILLTLEQQARWMAKNDIVTKAIAPNYLEFIYAETLESVKPEAMTIIR